MPRKPPLTNPPCRLRLSRSYKERAPIEQRHVQAYTSE